MSLLTVNIIVTSNKGRICNVSLGLVNDLISLFLHGIEFYVGTPWFPY